MPTSKKSSPAKSVTVKTKPVKSPSSPAKLNIIKATPTSIRSTFSELADDVLLSEREASDVAGYGPLTFKRWRRDKKGPRWLRVNGGVRYKAKAVREWMDSLSSGAA